MTTSESAKPVAFYGPDKDNPTKGASLPMIPDSWRFRIREQGGAIFIEAQDNGPWIPYAAVEPYLSVPRVKRATGRIIPDLTGIEHVCKYQVTIRAVLAAPQPQAPSATSDDVRAALADAREKALEEAAKVCDGINHQYTSSGGHAAERCAAAIRALRTTSEK